MWEQDTAPTSKLTKSRFGKGIQVNPKCSYDVDLLLRWWSQCMLLAMQLVRSGHMLLMNKMSRSGHEKSFWVWKYARNSPSTRMKQMSLHGLLFRPSGQLGDQKHCLNTVPSDWNRQKEVKNLPENLLPPNWSRCLCTGLMRQGEAGGIAALHLHCCWCCRRDYCTVSVVCPSCAPGCPKPPWLWIWRQKQHPAPQLEAVWRHLLSLSGSGFLWGLQQRGRSRFKCSAGIGTSAKECLRSVCSFSQYEVVTLQWTCSSE